MSREYGDGIQTHAVDTDHSWVFVFVFDIWCNGSDADAHGSDENKGIELLPLLSYLRTLDDLGFEFTLEGAGNLLPCLADLDDCYLHRHFSLFIFHFSLPFRCDDLVVSAQVHEGEETEQPVVVGIEITILEGLVLGIPESIHKLLTLIVTA